jgi:hypothetical protein
MMCLRRLVLMLVLIAPLAFAAGCAQGQGERCQVQSDCATGLLCILPAGGTPQAGGTCQGSVDAGILDMTMPNDVGSKAD